MARPKGVPEKKGLKRGRPVGSTEETNENKQKILELLEKGQCDNLTEAARELGLSPQACYKWRQRDIVWGKQVDLAIRACREVRADELEQDLATGENAAAKTFLLEGWRPETYRENPHIVITDVRTLELLEELKKAASIPDSEVEYLVEADNETWSAFMEGKKALPPGQH